MAMAIHFAVTLLVVTTITATAQQTPLPPPPLSTTHTPPPDIHQNIIDALIGPGGRATGKSFDPFLIPRRLNFSDLQKFAADSRIPTPLPSKSVVFTNNSASNFTIDASQIDIFSDSASAVHGISNILDYSVHGGGGDVISPPEPSAVGVRSDAADEFDVGLWVDVFLQVVKILLYNVIYRFLMRFIG